MQTIQQEFPGRQIEIEAQVQVEDFYKRVGFVSEGEPFIYKTTPHIKWYMSRCNYFNSTVERFLSLNRSAKAIILRTAIDQRTSENPGELKRASKAGGRCRVFDRVLAS